MRDNPLGLIANYLFLHFVPDLSSTSFFEEICERQNPGIIT